MSSNGTECSSCTRPAPDATICPGCTDQAAGYLRKIAWLADELTTSLVRQARFANPNGPRSRETPLMFDLGASENLEEFRTCLTRWSRAVSEHRGVRIDEPSTSQGLARWLLRWNGAAAQHPKAGDYVADLARITKSAHRAIDRAPDMRYLGPCEDCGQDMYVPDGFRRTDVRCVTEGCGAEYPLEERRAWLLEQTYGRLLTAPEMSRAIAALIQGKPPTPNLISLWAHRGKLTKYLPHARDPHQRPRYLVEDVIGQLHASMDKGKASA